MDRVEIRACLALWGVCALGCGPQTAADGGSAGGAGTDGDTPAADSNDGSGGNGPDDNDNDNDNDNNNDNDNDNDSTAGLEHGSIAVQFEIGSSVDGNPFEGTDTIVLTLDYDACLSQFYQANPGWTPDGPDGQTAFAPLSAGGEGWQDRLCDLSTIDCDVVSFDQELSAEGNRLTVTYAVSGTVDGGQLVFGPLPKPALASCSDGTLPIVRIASNGAARGFEGTLPDTTLLWSIQKFSPAEATTDQGAPLVIDIQNAD